MSAQLADVPPGNGPRRIPFSAVENVSIYWPKVVELSSKNDETKIREYLSVCVSFIEKLSVVIWSIIQIYKRNYKSKIIAIIYMFF